MFFRIKRNENFHNNINLPHNKRLYSLINFNFSKLIHFCGQFLAQNTDYTAVVQINCRSYKKTTTTHNKLMFQIKIELLFNPLVNQKKEKMLSCSELY